MTEQMEKGCIRPGLWRVEGYDVERVRGEGWVISQSGRVYGTCRTFAEACAMIWDELLP